MSTPLTSEEKREYTRIIDAILLTADLETVTWKKIRQGLERAIDRDLGDQKVALKELIEARFDAINSAEPPAMPTPPPASTANGSSGPETNGRGTSGDDDEDDDDDDDGEEIEVSVPAKKKQKRESSAEDADARLAAELQAQENQLAKGRTTRGGGTTSKPKKKRKKSNAKVKKEKRSRTDDSEDDGSASGSDAKPRKAGGGFQKPFNLSYPLAELCGENQLSRPQVVKKLWEHIKAHDLQDPKDKRQIRCDDMMQAVFKVSRVDMFQMNKLLGHQLYPIEEQ